MSFKDDSFGFIYQNEENILNYVDNINIPFNNIEEDLIRTNEQSNNKEKNRSADAISLKKTLIYDELRFSIETIIKILNGHFYFVKLRALEKINEFSFIKELNIKKAEIILLNFKGILSNLIKIQDKITKKKKMKYLIFWRYLTFAYRKANEYKEEIRKSVTEKYRKILEESEQNKIKIEIENSIVKKDITKNQEIEVEINKKNREIEDKEMQMMMNIKKLENEKKLIQEEILIFSDKESENINLNKLNFINNETGLNYEKDKGENSENKQNFNNSINTNKNFKGKKETLNNLEKKICEYEKRIKILIEENHEKDKKINSFMNDMNEILSKNDINLSLLFANTNDYSRDDICDKNTKIYSAKTSMRGSSYISNNFNNFTNMKNTIGYSNINNNSSLSTNLMINPNSIIVNNFSSQPNSVRNSMANNNPYRLTNFQNYNNKFDKILSNTNTTGNNSVFHFNFGKSNNNIASNNVNYNFSNLNNNNINNSMNEEQKYSNFINHRSSSKGHF